MSKKEAAEQQKWRCVRCKRIAVFPDGPHDLDACESCGGDTFVRVNPPPRGTLKGRSDEQAEP